MEEFNPYHEQKVKIISKINRITQKKKFKYKMAKDERFIKTINPNYGEEIIALNSIYKQVEEGKMSGKFQEGAYYIEFKILDQ